MRYALNGEIFINPRGNTLIAVPETMFVELCKMREERSAELTARGKNLHGYTFIAPEEEYIEEEGKGRNHV